MSANGFPTESRRRARRRALPDAREAALDRRRLLDRERPGRTGLQGQRQGASPTRDLRARGRLGQELARIQERKLSIRDKVAIERGGDTVATVHKALVGIRDRFAIDVEHGADMKAKGNVVDHEYEIERDGDTVARSPRSGSACGTPTASTSRPTRTPADPRDHRRDRLADHPRLRGARPISAGTRPRAFRLLAIGAEGARPGWHPLPDQMGIASP